MRIAKKPLNYGSVGIGLLNFITDEDQIVFRTFFAKKKEKKKQEFLKWRKLIEQNGQYINPLDTVGAFKICFRGA